MWCAVFVLLIVGIVVDKVRHARVRAILEDDANPAFNDALVYSGADAHRDELRRLSTLINSVRVYRVVSIQNEGQGGNKQSTTFHAMAIDVNGEPHDIILHTDEWGRVSELAQQLAVLWDADFEDRCYG